MSRHDTPAVCCEPPAHAAHEPPQSTPVSPWFWIPSLQDGHAAQGPPQSTLVSPWFWNPSLHVAQAPFQQVPTAQTWPQAPQLLVVPRSASQPLAALPSQSAKPALQTEPHTAATQVEVVCACGGQEAAAP